MNNHVNPAFTGILNAVMHPIQLACSHCLHEVVDGKPTPGTADIQRCEWTECEKCRIEREKEQLDRMG